MLTRSQDRKCDFCKDHAAVGLNKKWVCMFHLEEQLKLFRTQMEAIKKAAESVQVVEPQSAQRSKPRRA